MTLFLQNDVIANTTSEVAANTADTSDDDAQVAGYKKALDDLDRKTAAVSHAAQPTTPSGWWSTHSAMTMSASVLLFGAAVIAIAAFRAQREATQEETLRLYGTIMVITMAVFLVVAGYDDKQIAAPLGLLGTIVGYLLGRTTKTDPPETPPTK